MFMQGCIFWSRIFINRIQETLFDLKKIYLHTIVIEKTRSKNLLLMIMCLLKMMTYCWSFHRSHLKPYQKVHALLQSNDLYEIICLFHECEVWIVKSVRNVIAWQVMQNSDP